ncbi:MAG: lysophospholipid acyltransferase family protein [SAR324 cluster bacterium]|nr:lysophospholipid acyltransferase family protein [SAR324 cluster bacterium]
MTYLLALAVVFTTLWTSILTIFSTREMPESRYRSSFRVILWAKRVCAQMAVEIKVEFASKVVQEKGRPHMIMVNHRSYYDIPICMLGFKFWHVRNIAKAELFKIPIWNRAMKIAEIISIDRTNPQSAMESLEEAKRKMQDGIISWISPEGTRSPTDEMLPFKPGGFKMSMDLGGIIIPAIIVGADKILPKNGRKLTRGHQVTLRIGSPIDTQGLKKFERKQLMRDVREAMEALQKNDNLPYKFDNPEEAAAFVKVNELG